MTASRAVYLDSSAIVKLVVREPESAALRRYMRRSRGSVVSSALARAEVNRAVLHLGYGAARQAKAVLAHIDLIRVNNQVLTVAGALEPFDLRTLDAIHLATADLLVESLGRFVCYDDRLAAAAQAHGLNVHRPGSS